MRVLKVLLLAVAGVYVLVIATMFFAQGWLTFPAFMVSDERPPLPSGATRLEIATPDGERLQGIHLPPTQAAGGEKILVLAFGGNGWHVEGLVLDMRRHFPGREIAAFSYRGYRPSSGSPSAAALLADSTLVHDHVQKTFGPARVVAVGYSLGSGVAAHLARERPLAGLILVTPFDALEEVAQERFPWAPVRWLFRHSMASTEFLRDLHVPVAVIAAERDVVVPPARTEALRRAVSNLILDRTIPQTQHHDIFRSPDFAQAMDEAMAAILSSSRPSGAAKSAH